MKTRIASIALCLATASVACGSSASQTGMTPGGEAVTSAPVIECGAHSFLYVGAYEGRWADWHLSVDADGHSHATLTVVDGPTTTSDSADPALDVRFPGDVSFTIWEANGRGHFVQPYPGLPAGYDVAVDCQR